MVLSCLTRLCRTWNHKSINRPPRHVYTRYRFLVIWHSDSPRLVAYILIESEGRTEHQHCLEAGGGGLCLPACLSGEGPSRVSFHSTSSVHLKVSHQNTCGHMPLLYDIYVASEEYWHQYYALSTMDVYKMIWMLFKSLCNYNNELNWIAM